MFLQSEYAPILFALKMVMMEVLSIDQHESQVIVANISSHNMVDQHFQGVGCSRPSGIFACMGVSCCFISL